MSSVYKWCRFLAFLSLAAFVVGCGGNPNLGSVTGTVTLDGSPVGDALISFSPKKGGTPSLARTNAEGKYELQYTRNQSGAEIGEHSIRVTTHQSADPDSDPPTVAVPESIPLKYNYQTELVREVKAGSNTIDLPLKKDGPVVQPRVERD